MSECKITIMKIMTPMGGVIELANSPIKDALTLLNNLDDCQGALIRIAAPDLLDALEQIVFDWDGEEEDMFKARAAIAKAKGEI